MSEFRGKLIIAVVSAILGASFAFGSQLFLQTKGTAAARDEAARIWSYEFLKEVYDERKASYLEINVALQRVATFGTKEEIEKLTEAIRALPFLTPRYPTNDRLLSLGTELSQRLGEISEDQEAVRNFAQQEAKKYICIMDVNLSSIEELLESIASTDEQRSYRWSTPNELLFLADSCLE